ncbi:hypothetical protein, partial [Nonomuraea sp. NPDC049784]|uniref:hypothetical protein n=1 Tax=Nonomuraea sp. NPDC049784 TaxID=3154361 RepID=UPI0033C3233D
ADRGGGHRLDLLGLLPGGVCGVLRSIGFAQRELGFGLGVAYVRLGLLAGLPGQLVGRLDLLFCLVPNAGDLLVGGGAGPLDIPLSLLASGAGLLGRLLLSLLDLLVAVAFGVGDSLFGISLGALDSLGRLLSAGGALGFRLLLGDGVCGDRLGFVALLLGWCFRNSRCSVLLCQPDHGCVRLLGATLGLGPRSGEERLHRDVSGNLQGVSVPHQDGGSRDPTVTCARTIGLFTGP